VSVYTFAALPAAHIDNSHTRRHLSEYTHLEGELAFITFDDLMSHIETVVSNSQRRMIIQRVQTRSLDLPDRR
jgi:asparaginyl-tRNA synthetase